MVGPAGRYGKNSMETAWLNRNVFVTGCTGLLGSWLTRELADKGANVVGLVRDQVGVSNLFSQDSTRRMSLVRGQVEDCLLLERILSEYEIETVFHLAAQTIVGIANTNPLSTFESNVRGTYCLLEAVRRCPGVGRVIVASSDKAYGEQSQLPYTEDMPLAGRHPYDVSKTCADLLAQAYEATFGLSVCVTRCGNLFGGGDLNFNRLVPGTIRSVIFDQPVIIRSGGDLTRDYFFVLDAAQAYLHLAEFMGTGGVFGQAFNFGNDAPMSVLNMVKLILKLMDAADHPVKVLGQAPNEIKHQYLSSQKARRFLGWQPRYGLKGGLSRTIDWYRKHFEQRRQDAGIVAE